MSQSEKLHLCHTCNNQFAGELKQQKIHQVWRAGEGSMPTMSLDQLADMEIANMNKLTESNKRAEVESKRKEDEDEDRDDVSDRKIEEQRYWDNWKDMNEKGSGNKMGKL